MVNLVYLITWVLYSQYQIEIAMIWEVITVYMSSLPKPNKNAMKKRFGYRGAMIWNALPLKDKIQKIKSLIWKIIEKRSL